MRLGLRQSTEEILPYDEPIPRLEPTSFVAATRLPDRFPYLAVLLPKLYVFFFSFLSGTRRPRA